MGIPHVFASERLLEHAKARYPPGGSTDGTPSYEIFCNGPLGAAALDFGLGWDSLPFASDRTDIRSSDQFSRIFGPLVFLARQIGDRKEMLDFVDDPDYDWDEEEDD